MNQKNNTFCKEERLCSYKTINQLFEKGNSFLIFPFRVVWLPLEDSDSKYPVKLLVQAPKKLYKRANKRNYIKRLTKEAYRINKHLLYETLLAENKKIALSLIFISKEIPTYTFINHKIILILQRLIKTEVLKTIKKD